MSADGEVPRPKTPASRPAQPCAMAAQFVPAWSARGHAPRLSGDDQTPIGDPPDDDDGNFDDDDEDDEDDEDDDEEPLQAGVIAVQHRHRASTAAQ